MNCRNCLIRGLHQAFFVQHATSSTSRKISPNQFGAISNSSFEVRRLVKPRPQKNFDELPPQRKAKVIDTPVGIGLRHLEQLAHTSDDRNHGRLLIECFRKQQNFYEDSSTETPLYSHFWYKNKYKNDWFRIKRKTFKQDVDFNCSWDDCRSSLNDVVVDNLIRLGFRRPHRIQAQVIRCLPGIHATQHVFLAAETGSGKTAAFGASLLSFLIKERSKGRNSKAIIVTATGSLSEQTYKFLCELADGTDLSVKKCVPSLSRNAHQEGTSVAEPQMELNGNEWDLLIGTPGLMVKNLQKLEDPSIVKQIVLDEADMILDSSFVDVLTDIFALVPVAHSETNRRSEDRENGARLIFCSASCPEELSCIAEGVVDQQYLSYIKTDRLHSMSPTVEMTFVRVREMDKIDKLCSLLEKDLAMGQMNKTIVFCKDKHTVKFVVDALREGGVEPFLWTSGTISEDLKDHRIIVSSDSASRGLDIPDLSHVINYDMARHMVDFLHRSGRVGRLSSRFAGRVTSFIRTPSEVYLTNAIESAARLGINLTDHLETDVSGVLANRKTKEN